MMSCFLLVVTFTLLNEYLQVYPEGCEWNNQQRIFISFVTIN